MTILALTLSAALLAQAPPDPTRLAQEWLPLDGVALRVGDQILTLRHLETFFRDNVREMGLSLTTQEEFEEAYARAIDAKVTHLLETEAGRELGLDPAEVERRIERFHAEQRQERGATGFVAYLEEQGLDPIDAVRNQSGELFQQIWRNKVVGDTRFTGERPVRDAYIRPGELLDAYRSSRHQLAEPDRVRLEVLDVPAEPPGGLAEAELLAHDLRQRILDGEDFAALVAEYGATHRETQGLTDVYAVPGLIGDELRGFAATAEVGDVSPLLAWEAPERGQLGWRIVRLHTRIEGSPPPPFEDPSVQRLVRRAVRRQRAEWHLQRARMGLRDDTAIWVHPFLHPFLSRLDGEPLGPLPGARARAERRPGQGGAGAAPAGATPAGRAADPGAEPGAPGPA